MEARSAWGWPSRGPNLGPRTNTSQSSINSHAQSIVDDGQCFPETSDAHLSNTSSHFNSQYHTTMSEPVQVDPLACKKPMLKGSDTPHYCPYPACNRSKRGVGFRLRKDLQRHFSVCNFHKENPEERELPPTKHSGEAPLFYRPIEVVHDPENHSSSYLPKLEANFMRDFNCCSKILPTLADLLRHYEDAHTGTSPSPNIAQDDASSQFSQMGIRSAPKMPDSRANSVTTGRENGQSVAQLKQQIQSPRSTIQITGRQQNVGVSDTQNDEYSHAAKQAKKYPTTNINPSKSNPSDAPKFSMDQYPLSPPLCGHPTLSPRPVSDPFQPGVMPKPLWWEQRIPQNMAQNPRSNTLSVANLPIDFSEEELKALFSRQPGYERLCFRTNRNGPICFVEFEAVSFATKALFDLNGQPLHNSVNGGIRLSFSKNPLGVELGQGPGQDSASALSRTTGMGPGATKKPTMANDPPLESLTPLSLRSRRTEFTESDNSLTQIFNENHYSPSTGRDDFRHQGSYHGLDDSVNHQSALNIGEFSKPYGLSMTQLVEDNIGKHGATVLDLEPGSVIDSGYGSISRGKLTMKATESSRLPSDSVNDTPAKQQPDDNITCYTGSTVGGQFAQEYIEELAEDIYNHIQRDMSRKEWKAISKNALKFLKAFAIKIGHNANTPTHRKVMQFVHKHCGAIVAGIETLFSGEDDAPKIKRDSSDNMSVLEKMALWTWKSDSRPVAENDCLFEGVPDDNDNDIDATDISIYRNVITASPSYGWLLGNLRKELLIAVQGLESEALGESIKEKILNQLPSGVISKHTPPLLYDMTFELLGDPMVFSHQLSQELQPENALSNTITFMSSSKGSHATTALDYLRFMWPSSGEHLGRMLQQFRSLMRGLRVVERLSDGTELSAYVESNRLKVTVCSPAYSVAELGEQLAWLGAALQLPLNEQLTSCTPYIVGHVSKDEDWSHPVSTRRRAHCTIGFKLEPMSHKSCTDGIDWRRILGDRVIVKGFHIPRTAISCWGFDTSFNILRQLTGGGNIMQTHKGVFLHGSRCLLVLLKEINEAFVWRLLDHNAANVINEPEFKDNSPWDSSISHMEASRHFVTTCASPSCSSASHGTRNESQNQQLANPICQESDSISSDETTTTSGVQYRLPDNTGCTMQESFVRSRSPGSLDRWLDDERQFSHPSSYQNAQRGVWSEESISQSHSEIVATTISSEDAIDSDMLSISDQSVHLDPFGLGSDAFEILTRVLHKLLEEWHAIRNYQESPERSSHTPTQSQIPSSAAFSSTSRLRGCQKRSRALGMDGNSEEDVQTRTKKRRVDSPARKCLACPFWKKNPSRYRDCFPRKLSRIRDVKQHISRKHTPAFYCERCFELFENGEIHRMHVMANERCPAKLYGKVDGVSHEQRKALSSKSKPGHTEPQQWYAIWQVLFPDLPKPDSPYMDFELSQDFCEWVEFCQRRGPSIVAEEVNGRFDEMALLPESERSLQIRHIVEHGFQSAFRQFQCPSVSTPSSVPREQSSTNYGSQSTLGSSSNSDFLENISTAFVYDGPELSQADQGETESGDSAPISRSLQGIPGVQQPLTSPEATATLIGENSLGLLGGSGQNPNGLTESLGVENWINWGNDSNWQDFLSTLGSVEFNSTQPGQ